MRDKTYLVKCDLLFILDDVLGKNRIYEIEATSEFNAAANLQFMIGDHVMIDIISIKNNDAGV